MSELWGVILNPKAGSKKVDGKQTICDALKSGGISGEYRFSEYAGHATILARELVADGFRNFLIVGGDGSVSEVVDGLMTSGVDSHELTIAIIPSGTGNDWCRYWKIPKKIGLCLDMIRQGKKQWIDIGRLSYFRQDSLVEKYFINSVGLGFDAEIVARAEKLGKFAKGLPVNYFLGLVGSMAKTKSKHLVMETDNEVFEGKVYTMSIANGPYSGGGIKQTPDASPTDGLFDILLADDPNAYEIVRDVSRVLFRQSFGGVLRTYRTSQVKISTTERHMIEADGIVQTDGEAPLHITMVPAAIKMIVC
ncbi:MAG: diacylglycerol kinase family lipid kinase [Paludibacteraceae bacterium]|nr:diacylglycerol kinase family lipid kinase [Paludibacteraceae bacterium]